MARRWWCEGPLSIGVGPADMLDLAAELLAVFGFGIACLVYFLVLKPLWSWLDKQPARSRRLLVPFRAIGMAALVVALFPVVVLFE